VYVIHIPVRQIRMYNSHVCIQLVRVDGYTGDMSDMSTRPSHDSTSKLSTVTYQMSGMGDNNIVAQYRAKACYKK